MRAGVRTLLILLRVEMGMHRRCIYICISLTTRGPGVCRVCVSVRWREASASIVLEGPEVVSGSHYFVNGARARGTYVFDAFPSPAFGRARETLEHQRGTFVNLRDRVMMASQAALKKQQGGFFLMCF